MDKYELGQSNIGYISKEREEIRLDLQLEKNHHYNDSLIYGCIDDLCGSPIDNACVAFFNKNNIEIGSVYTSQEGFYSYMGVKTNTIIKIRIAKKGYIPSTSNYIFICSKMINYNATLKKCPVADKALISGHLLNEKNNPLKNIPIYLLKKSHCVKNPIYKSTNSNTYGQFVFLEIPKGNYTLLVNNSVFNVYNKVLEITESRNIYNVDIKLIRRVSNTKFGIVKNKNGTPVSNALVILFKINHNNKLIPIKYTTSDEQGEYLFNDVPHGNYIVKAKQCIN